MFDSEALEAVVIVAETASFREASTLMGISRSTLTRYIQKVEKHYGFPIFERTTRAVYATPQGAIFIGHCREICRVLGRFTDTVAQIRDNETPLRIGCGPLAAPTFVESTLQALLEIKPETRVHIRVAGNESPVTALRNRELDVVIVDLTHVVPFEDLEVILLGKQEIVAVVRPGHPLVHGRPHKLATVLQHPMALPHLHKYWQTTFSQAMGQRTPDTNPSTSPAFQFSQVECDDYSLLAELTRLTDLVSGGARENFQHYLDSGELIEIPLANPIYSNLCAARLKGASFQIITDFWDLIGKFHAKID